MGIIKTHDVTLYGGTNDCEIVLRPLSDSDLPLLYKWGADPEVVYWSDTGNVNDFDEEMTRNIYGSVSQNGLCFIAEVNGHPIGNFWVQKMNIPEVAALYPGLDVRRIEAEIGEKNYWGRGIGTEILRMLIEHTFYVENVDILHCFTADYNLRSQRLLLKHGFVLCGEDDIEDSLRAKKEYHYRLTREDYIKHRLPSYSAIITHFGGINKQNDVVILTDNTMYKTARYIQNDSMAFSKSIDIINLDDTNDYEKIYMLKPDDLLILHIGIESWTGTHKCMAYAFDKPKNIAAKYICIRPTITAEALREGLNTPLGVIEKVIEQYSNQPYDKPIRVKSNSGTDISLNAYKPWIAPFNTHKPGANAYLPPAEISYSVKPGTANGIIVADVTVGELRVHADLINPFGIVDQPVSIHILNGNIIDITGSEMAQQLKTEIWKLPASCRRVVELGFGLSTMTPSGIIGIDESIAGTCHFGFGNGSGNDAPIHLDVVVSGFTIKLF